MKRKKKNTFIFVAIVLVVSIISISVSATLISNAENSKAEKAILLEMEKQKQAVAADNALMEYFFKEGEGIVYPDFFAGRYIEDGIYYLCLYNPPEGTEETYNALFGDNKEKVVYLYKDYSYNELLKQAYMLSSNLKNSGYTITYSAVNNTNGNIEIGVSKEEVSLIVSKINYLEKSSSFTVNVIPTDKYVPRNASFRSGSKINVLNNGDFNSTTIGIMGKYKGRNAIVTCGHGYSEGDFVYYNGAVIGVVEKQHYKNGGNGDYSIIPITNSTYTIKHTVGSTSHGISTFYGGTVSNPSVGTIVKSYGYVSGYSYSQVVNADLMLDFDSLNMYGLSAATLLNGASQSGDSGGPYMVDSSFCGIFSGDIGSILIFTPYSVLQSQSFTACSDHNNTTGWSDYNSGYHSGYCSICVATVNEPHYKYLDTNGDCSRCGRTGYIDIIQ